MLQIKNKQIVINQMNWMKMRKNKRVMLKETWILWRWCYMKRYCVDINLLDRKYCQYKIFWKSNTSLKKQIRFEYLIFAKNEFILCANRSKIQNSVLCSNHSWLISFNISSIVVSHQLISSVECDPYTTDRMQKKSN